MAFTKHVSSAGRIRTLIVAVTTVLVTGTGGFHLIEGASLFDAFYMTLITLTTIGYHETLELSRYGRYFNAVLILTGFSVIFVAVGMLVDVLIRLEALDRFQQRALRRMLQKTSGHYIICGFGRVGRGVLRQLQIEKAKVIVIDKTEPGEHQPEELDVPVLLGDATLHETLEQAGTRRARGLVAALSSDAENVYVTLSARALNPNLRIVARASSQDAKQRLLQAGANDVVLPYASTGYWLAQGLSRPHVSAFFGDAVALERAGAGFEIGEFAIKAGSDLDGKPLSESGFVEEFDIVVLALARPGQKARFNPPRDTSLHAGDVLIVIGRRAAVDRVISATAS